jgi:hypothetical protein
MYLGEAVKLLNGDFKAIVILEVFPGYFASVKGNSIVVNYKIHYGAYKLRGCDSNLVRVLESLVRL